MPGRVAAGAAGRPSAGLAYHPAVVPLLVLGLGLALLVAGWLVLRSFGPRLRVGRLLASTPRVSVEQALALADAGTSRYVRVAGRLDSDEPFEDADHRPLVLRRTRIEIRDGRGWRTVEETRQGVPFELREGLHAIGIDSEALDEGLVVVPRESTGTAGDLGPRQPVGVSGVVPVRLRIQQISAVEHAVALGVPVRDGGAVRLTAGLGRPLVLTTLEPREAMRVLAQGRTREPRLAAGLLLAGGVIVAVGLVALIVDALA